MFNDTLQNARMLTTAEAAQFIRHAPQTLRRWACYQDGPVLPVKVGRKLLWPLAELQALVVGGAIMRKNARQPKPTSTHPKADYRLEPEQFELLPPPEFKPSWPERATNPAQALERLIAGERLTQPSFGLNRWRLAAYVKALDYLGWPIRAGWVHSPGHLRPIKEYWLDQKTISAALSLRGGAA